MRLDGFTLAFTFEDHRIDVHGIAETPELFVAQQVFTSVGVGTGKRARLAVIDHA